MHASEPLPNELQPLISATRIRRRVAELATEITAAFPARDAVFIGILRGSFMFLADLVRGLEQHHLHPRIDFMTLDSYGSGTESSGSVRVLRDIRVPVHGAEVLLVDDILDTGRTLSAASRALKAKGARLVHTCVLLDKPARRVVPFKADYVGFSIKDVFVVGYGLDYDSRFRELPYIAKLSASFVQRVAPVTQPNR